MRKKQIALLCVLSLLVANCTVPMGGGVQAGTKSPALSKKKAAIRLGETVKLSVKRAKGFRITWKTNNKKVATVKKSGKYAVKVTGKKVGKAKITAKLKKGKKRYSLKCQITVLNKNPIVTALPQVEPEVPAVTGTPAVTPVPSELVPAVTSPSDGTTIPPSGETTVPGEKPTGEPGETMTQKPGETATQKPGETATQKPGETATQKPVETATQKPGETATQKPGETATHKPGETATQKPTATPTQKPTATPTQKPTATPTQKPTVTPTAKPEATPTTTPTQTPVVPVKTEAPDLTKNMSSEAKVKGGWGNIKGSVDETGATAELTEAEQYNQIDFQMNYPVPLSTVEKVEFTLKVTGTPDNVSFKLYDSEGEELQTLTQYGIATGTYSITIPSELKSKTVSQFSIMTSTGIEKGDTQTATAILSSLLFVPAASATMPVKTPVPTEKPVQTETPVRPPSEEIEAGELMILSADTRLDAAAKKVEYNEDGSVKVSVSKDAGGGGICFYIDPLKNEVDLNDYTKVIFDVSADADVPVVLNEYSERSFWGNSKTISYTRVSTGRNQLSADLSNDQVLGVGIRYAAWNADATADPLTLTIHSITLVRDVRDTSDALTNYSSLFEMAADYGFKMGTVFNTNTATDKKYGELMKYHFNSITASNEMKAYSMLDEGNSKKSYVDEESMPVVNFTNADVVMDYAKNSGIKVRGHVLVWDADMCDWFFREGYDVGKPYASEEVVTARVKNYIEQVLVHFEQKYPGVVYCWDVVNEAVSDAEKEHEVGDARMIRTTRDGKVNRFYERLGDHYVEKVFQYTYEAIQKNKSEYPGMENIKLYYNDFNTFYATKRDAICELVKSINSTLPDDEGGFVKLCDGVGMQSYIGGFGHQNGCMNDNDIALVKAAILKFADCGVEVQATELAVRNYESDAQTLEKHGAFYKKLFQTYMDINKERADKPVKAVSIWGIVDRPDMPESDYSYRMNGPFCGLFDEKLGVKPAFVQVHDLMKGEK